jgi:UMF1 family MFS transporter
MTAHKDPSTKRQAQWSWALYDWANSAFATTVLAGFFPIIFNDYWAKDLSPEDSTFWQGVAAAVASVVVMLLAPLLGGLADRKGYKKRFLMATTLLGASATASLFFIPEGQWAWCLFLFTVASIGFFAGISFYDALITHVADEADFDRVSAMGYALGYLGGGLLFSLNVLMALKPTLFGFPEKSWLPVQVSFLMVAAWWVLFSLPLFKKVPEAEKNTASVSPFKELLDTFKRLKTLPNEWLFLLGYWFYIDGVDTVVRMAVDYGQKLGFPSSSLISALLMVQFIGFPAAIAFGYLAGKVGNKSALYAAVVVYIGVTLWAYSLKTVDQFYMMAAAIGCVQGGVQAVSRSFYAKLIPADAAGQFFGFYNMLGKFAAVLGPLLMGITAKLAGQQYSILALLPLFLLGLFFLSRVRYSPPATS